MLFGEPRQRLDRDRLTAVRQDAAAECPEALMHFAAQHECIGLGNAFRGRQQRDVETAFAIGEAPGIPVVAWIELRIDPANLVYATVENQRVLRCGAVVTEVAEIETDAAPVGQESVRARPAG